MSKGELLVNWTDDYLVHYPIIDEQHRGLISTINTLQYFLDEDWPISSLRRTIETLEDHVQFHFITEETILLRHGMPEAGMEVINKYKLQFLKELRAQVTNAIIMAEANDLTEYLAKWWEGHLSEFHDKLKEYFDPEAAYHYSPD